LSRTLHPDIYLEIVRGYRKGFRLVFIMLASLAVFSFIVAFFLMRHRDLDRPDDEKLKKEGKEYVAQLKAKRGATVRTNIEKV
jgi:phosphotransferase system  glucose/maltose/N-acetylglucosamine-specific IIC component